MPLDYSGTKKAFEKNMHELKHAAKKRPLKQMLAIAFAAQRRGKKKK